MRGSRYTADTPLAQRLRHEMDVRGWNGTQLAEILGRPPQMVSEVLNGKKTVTAWTALQLEAAMKVPAEEWMRLRYMHELDEARNGRRRW